MAISNITTLVLSMKLLNYGQSFIATRNTTRCNNRDDLLQLSFTLKVLIFSEAHI